MSFFRTHTPKRRDITVVVAKYSDHREDLKIDYQHRCGYCNDSDKWKIMWFEIDHFVPIKYLKTILETDYSNLVYSCRSCNNAKRSKWPTQEENIHHHNDEGFIDPCNDDYNQQFTRMVDGKIVPLTKIGHWMYHALQLYKPQHEIIWNIEQLDSMIEEIEKLSINSDSSLSIRLLDCYRQYREYIDALTKIGA